MGIIWVAVILQVAVSALTAPFAAWVFEQARKDEAVYTKEDDEDLRLVALLRKDNAYTILLSVVVFVCTEIFVLGLLVGGAGKWFVLAVEVTSVRSLIVQLFLLRLCIRTWKTRAEVKRLKDARERYQARRDKRESDTSHT